MANPTSHGRERSPRTDGGRDVDESPEQAASSEEMLVTAGILEPTSDGSDLQLTEEFERAWQERISKMRSGDRALRWLAATHDADADDFDVVEEIGRYAITHEGSVIEEWPSEATFFAALVAEPTMQEWLDDDQWARLDESVREELAVQLLIFLEQCPACDGDLELTEEPEDSGGIHLSLQCLECGAPILEGAYQ